MTDDARRMDSERTLVSASHEVDGEQRWHRELEPVYGQLGLGLDDDRARFAAEISARTLGDLRLDSIQALPHRVWRTSEMANRDQRSDLVLCLIVDGAANVSQSGRIAHLERGAFALLDAARPFAYEALSDVTQVSVLVPRFLLGCRLPERLMADVTATTVRGDGGAGGLVSHLLCDVAKTPSDSNVSENGLAGPTVDMIATVLGGLAGGISGRSIAQTEELRRAQTELEKGMHDPDRSLADVASSLGMSLRALHKLFNAYGMTPNAWLYQARLEKARRLLASTDLSAFEVSERVGFRDVSHFTRSFRKQFNQTPGQLRAAHRGQ